jgi:hypothetical protein
MLRGLKAEVNEAQAILVEQFGTISTASLFVMDVVIRLVTPLFPLFLVHADMRTCRYANISESNLRR